MSSYDEHLISQAGGGDVLDQIQRRADKARRYASRVHIQESADDVPALLALVREQAAKLDLLTMALEEADEDCCCGVCGL